MQAADVLTLNELNGWSGNMQRYARDAGFRSATLLDNGGSAYHVGAMTTHPHTVALQDCDAFQHGLLAIKCGGITILITHLCPGSARKRRDETQRIVEIIEGIRGPVMLVGDLNTLSPLDRDVIARKEVLETLRSTPALARKFLNEEGMPDYEPMETLLSAGLEDVGANQRDRSTVPTPFNQDPAHALPLRLDYMLVNDAFLERWQPAVNVVKNPTTGGLSDHYPILCDAMPVHNDLEVAP